jgi:hypothetical protein
MSSSAQVHNTLRALIELAFPGMRNMGALSSIMTRIFTGKVLYCRAVNAAPGAAAPFACLFTVRGGLFFARIR